MRIVTIAVAVSLTVTGCAKTTETATPSTPEPSGPSAGESLERDGRFTIMIELLGGFAERMDDASWNGTLFAPTDETFAALPPEILLRLRDDANLAARTAVIRSHILPFRLPSERFETRSLTTAHASDELEMVVAGNSVTVDGAVIVEADLITSTGIVHVIDQVLGLDRPG